ncbi:hypothetical protein Syn7502_00139 [Synechococcus sp. PCC 7502]|nr:hypothetical protein Syn7502_00139 [Synechococcus sp. PCC 7502]
MNGKIIAIYYLLRSLHHYSNPQQKMSGVEVMTTAIIAGIYFGGNIEKARELLGAPNLVMG